MASVEVTSTARTSTGLILGETGFVHTRNTAREIIETIVIPDGSEVSFATVITDARLLYIENQSSVTDNFVSYGLTTGVYLGDVYPGQKFNIPFTGKPDNPTIYLLFATASGGSVRLGIWD